MYQYSLSHYYHRQYASVLLIIVVLITMGCGKTTTPQEPIYTIDTLIYLESEGYTYIARITADTFLGATEVPVQIFAPHLQRKLGDTLPIGRVKAIRKEPKTGWTTLHVAAEYFDGTKWKFEWNIQEMEDYYLLPETFQGVRRIDFSNIRFPLPVHRSANITY